MQALEFEATLNEAAQIQVPAELAAELPAGSHVKVVVMWDDEDEAWRQVGRRNLGTRVVDLIVACESADRSPV